MPVLERLTRAIRRGGGNVAKSNRDGSSHWDAYLSGRSTADWPRYPVSDRDALGLTAFYRGVSLISGSIAGLPLDVYRETRPEPDGSKVRSPVEDAATAPLWSRPNDEMRRSSFWERLIADEVRGNAYIFVVKNRDGSFASLWYLDRRRVRVGRNSAGLKIYEVDREQPMIDYRQGGEIVHIPNWGDGLTGYDPVSLAAEAIRLGLSAEEYASRHFDAAVPPGLLSTDQELSVEQANDLSDRWEQMHASLSMNQRIAVLGRGVKFQTVAIEHEKMQMEQLRRFQVEEIARLLGIPSHLLGDTSKSTTWGSGLEEQNRSFVTLSLMPHAIRFEQAMDDLLVKELTGRYARFNFAGLLRGSTKERYEAYAQADFMSDDEKRALEDLPQIGGLASQLFKPVNKAPLEAFEGASVMQPGAGAANGG